MKTIQLLIGMPGILSVKKGKGIYHDKMKSITKLCLLFIMVLVSVNLVFAQDEEDLSQQAANPIANLMSFPFQNNTNFGIGPYDRTSNVLNIQPVIPFFDGMLITRSIFPIVWIPDVTQESGMVSTGLSDILLTAFYVPPSEKLTWGPGLAIEIPSGGEKRGSEKWGVGPSIVLLVQPGDWTFGLLANNIWSVAGNSDAADVNKGLINLFIVRQLGEGWYVTSAPIITVNWNAESGQQWSVPIGAGTGKLSFVGGKLPLNIQIHYYYYVVKPDFGPDWQLRTQIQVLLPTSILGG